MRKCGVEDDGEDEEEGDYGAEGANGEWEDYGEEVIAHWFYSLATFT